MCELILCIRYMHLLYINCTFILNKNINLTQAFLISCSLNESHRFLSIHLNTQINSYLLAVSLLKLPILIAKLP